MKATGKSLVPLLLLGLLPVPFSGCLTEDEATLSDIGDTTGHIYDPFPKPIGNSMLALHYEPTSRFRYVEMDGQSSSRTVHPEFPLFIRRRDADTYGYAFLDSTRGLLLQYRRPGDDIAGPTSITRPS